MIAASRNFVCVRMLTYECAEEESVLEGVFTGRSGDLENTTFAILAPDGKTRLTRAGRGPKGLFGREPQGIKTMASEMAKISKKYPGKKNALKGAPLPLIADVRRALNVAACDNQPLVIVVAKDEKEQASLQTKLAKLAWDEKNIGAFLFVSTTEAKDLATVSGVKKGSGYIVIQPDAYGQKGEGLTQVPASASAKTIQAALDKARGTFEELDKSHHREHVRQGKRNGVHWDTEIPVTDPGKGPTGRGGR